MLVGKCTMHELGIGMTGLNPRTGTARNPYNPHRAAGGAASGSAAIVSAGICAFALGQCPIFLSCWATLVCTILLSKYWHSCRGGWWWISPCSSGPVWSGSTEAHQGAELAARLPGSGASCHEHWAHSRHCWRRDAGQCRHLECRYCCSPYFLSQQNNEGRVLTASHSGIEGARSGFNMSNVPCAQPFPAHVLTCQAILATAGTSHAKVACDACTSET